MYTERIYDHLELKRCERFDERLVKLVALNKIKANLDSDPLEFYLNAH